MEQWIRGQLRSQRMAKLSAMTVDELKAIWDRYPDDGSTIVDGHDCDDVYLVLCMKGHGNYCNI